MFPTFAGNLIYCLSNFQCPYKEQSRLINYKPPSLKDSFISPDLLAPKLIISTNLFSKENTYKATNESFDKCKIVDVHDGLAILISFYESFVLCKLGKNPKKSFSEFH